MWRCIKGFGFVALSAELQTQRTKETVRDGVEGSVGVAFDKVPFEGAARPLV